jgi:hypothetical protein
MEHIHQDATGTWHFDPYFAYLATISSHLPAEVAAFASDPAHYTLDDPQSLHDAWLEHLSVLEPATGTRAEIRQTELVLTFLGPRHDRMQILHYSSVREYRIEGIAVARGHGDLLLHEVRLGVSGTVIHELRFANGSWISGDCASFRYHEEPRHR